MSAFKTIALIGRYNVSDATPLATMGAFLRKQGREVLVEKETAATSRISGFPFADYEEIGARADLAVVQGGDGSMLNAARHLAAHRVPLVGVNLGRLGVMTDIAASAGFVFYTWGQTPVYLGSDPREKAIILGRLRKLESRVGPR